MTEEREPSLPSRLIGAPARGARRVARASGIEQSAEAVAEETIVRALESQAVERALSRVLEGPALEAAVDRALRSPAVERSLSRAIDSQMTERLWEQLLASDEAQKLVERIAEAPEVRAAIASQGVGFVEDLARTLARGAHRLDGVAEDVARRLLGRARREAEPPQAGMISRTLAFLVDGGLLAALFLAASAALAQLLSLLVEGDPDRTATVAAGTGLWIVTGSIYLVTFWSLAGQTPGMRFLRIRVEPVGAETITARRAIRRLVGGALSAICLGLGFVAVLFDERRRGWLDRIARTEVRYTSTEPKAAPWSDSETGDAPQRA